MLGEVGRKVIMKMDSQSSSSKFAAGYMFNIKMLKVIFAPEFQLHDIR